MEYIIGKKKIWNMLLVGKTKPRDKIGDTCMKL